MGVFRNACNILFDRKVDEGSTLGTKYLDELKDRIPGWIARSLDLLKFKLGLSKLADNTANYVFNGNNYQDLIDFDRSHNIKILDDMLFNQSSSSMFVQRSETSTSLELVDGNTFELKVDYFIAEDFCSIGDKMYFLNKDDGSEYELTIESVSGNIIIFSQADFGIPSGYMVSIRPTLFPLVLSESVEDLSGGERVEITIDEIRHVGFIDSIDISENTIILKDIIPDIPFNSAEYTGKILVKKCITRIDKTKNGLLYVGPITDTEVMCFLKHTITVDKNSTLSKVSVIIDEAYDAIGDALFEFDNGFYLDTSETAHQSIGYIIHLNNTCKQLLNMNIEAYLINPDKLKANEGKLSELLSYHFYRDKAERELDMGNQVEHQMYKEMALNDFRKVFPTSNSSGADMSSSAGSSITVFSNPNTSNKYYEAFIEGS